MASSSIIIGSMDSACWSSRSERFLDDRSIDIPFSLMWANENWTRRWDGAESEVLISQDYRPDDDEKMAAEFARHFQDPRYIRVQGRPLLMIYRPGLIPEPARTVSRWREIFKTQHGEDPILIMAQSFTDIDPMPYGMDGAIEFPPHKLTQHMPPINASLEYLDSEFTGHVYSYDEVVRTSLDEPAPTYPLIKTAVPSWDNDARRQGTGLCITGSSPAKYEHWLGRLGEIARKKPFFGEPIVCVNAWNEWCEGTYLEPDLHYGSAYLNATARAVAGLSRRTAVPRLLLIGHDAFPSGAQLNLLAQGRAAAPQLRCGHSVLVAGRRQAGERLRTGWPADYRVLRDDLARQAESLGRAGLHSRHHQHYSRQSHPAAGSRRRHRSDRPGA